MKIKQATVIFVENNEEISWEFPEMDMKELAHKLLEKCRPVLQIAIADSQRRVFESEAKRDYNKAKTFQDYESYIDLYVRLKIDSYIRLEHAKQSYNELALALVPNK